MDIIPQIVAPWMTSIGKKAKFYLAKAHSAYQTASQEGQKSRLEETVYYKMTSSPYLQHYVSYINEYIPYINFYPRNDVIMDTKEHWNQHDDCFCICAGKVLSIPKRLDNVSFLKNHFTLSQDTELASASLQSDMKPGRIDVLDICQKFQANINANLNRMTLADIMPYFNFIIEDSMSLHVPLHTFTLSVEYFDEEDDTQYVTFNQNDAIFS